MTTHAEPNQFPSHASRSGTWRHRELVLAAAADILDHRRSSDYACRCSTCDAIVAAADQLI